MEIPVVDEPVKHPGNTFPRRTILLVIAVVFGFGLSGTLGYFLGSAQFAPKVKNAAETGLSPDTAENQSPAPTAETVCGIDKFRLSAPSAFGGKQYFVYRRNSMNRILPQAEKNYLESGVFVADDENGKNCKKLIEMFDGSPAKNNIYEFLNDNGMLYVLAVDQFGAGSGEGNAKILKSNDGGKSWEVKYCFYYTPDTKVAIKDFISGTRGDIPLLPLDNPYCSDFILGAAGGRLR